MIGISLKFIIQSEIRQNAEIIKHDCDLIDDNLNLGRIDFKNYLKIGETLLREYSEYAELIITSRLHCALPCIAMGIKVILVLNNDEQKTRFSAGDGIIKYYSIDDFKKNRVSYDFEEPNIEELKGFLLENLKHSVDKVLGNAVNDKKLKIIRKNIAEYSIFNFCNKF